jgi:hypothetical protein
MRVSESRKQPMHAPDCQPSVTGPRAPDGIVATTIKSARLKMRLIEELCRSTPMAARSSAMICTKTKHPKSSQVKSSQSKSVCYEVVGFAMHLCKYVYKRPQTLYQQSRSIYFTSGLKETRLPDILRGSINSVVGVQCIVVHANDRS